MVKMVRIASVAGMAAVAVAGCLLGLATVARAVSTSDKPAGIVVWPKIVVDSSGRFGPPTDTVLQLSNTDTHNLKQAHCFYIDATSHCADTGNACQSATDCGPTGGPFAPCVPGWQEIDFDVFLTFDQPLAWDASKGLAQGDTLLGGGLCANPPGRACFQDSDCSDVCVIPQNNVGSGVPPTAEDPFVGSLECIEFDPAQNPPLRDLTNTLKGEATILVAPVAASDGVDVQKYNAVGLTALSGNNNQGNVLQIGRSSSAGATGTDPTQEYSACPATLILNHLFDGATDPLGLADATLGIPAGITTTTTTDLTLIPCGNNFLTQTPGLVTAQFLVFNEFEQRFSTSQTVDCFFERQLSKIDTRTPGRSIFNAGVSGTIAGQTRIRGVGSAATGRGLLGVARLFIANTSSPTRPAGAAYNLHQQGDPAAGTQPDLITLP